MRYIFSAIAVSLFALQAQAQTSSTTTPAASTPAATSPAAATPAPADTTAPGSAPHSHTRMTWQQRFDQANTSHDGHLTLDQAKTGMPRVAKHFDAIDKDKKGYVTVEDIHAYMAQRRAAAHHAGTHHTASPS